MNNQQSVSGKDIVKGAVIGAAIASVVAVLMNKDTRDKITKSMKDTMDDMKRRAEKTKKEAKEKAERATEQMEERFPKKEPPIEQP